MLGSRTCLLIFFQGIVLAQTDPRPPLEIQLGRLTLRPSGFLEAIGETRTATDTDSVSTRFGAIPLTETPAESIASLAHSRVQMKSGLRAGDFHFDTYIESDFLNPVPDSAPWRWRQYWGSVRHGKWELLGGQVWSLLRPNRSGIQSDRDLMNTEVIEPAYHVGLAGTRKRQVRVARAFGQQHIAVAWENNGNYVAKLTTDRGIGHAEIAGFSGRSGRRGASVASVLHAADNVRIVSQQFWSHRAISEALGLVPQRISGIAAIAGVEADVRRHLEVYAYGGVVYGSRSAGNRVVRQWSAGFNYRRPTQWRGAVLISLQYSYLDRAIWDGRSGVMNYVMYRLRYTFN